MQVLNQKPVELSPVYKPKITGAFDPVDALCQTVIDPLLTPLNTTAQISITNNGASLDKNDLAKIVLDCCGDAINTNAENTAKDLFHQTLIYFDKSTNLSIQELFAIQSARKENMPEPSPMVIYVPATDIIPTCREFLGGICTFDKLFASFAFFARPRTLGFYFMTENEFDLFKTWLSGQVSAIAASLPADTIQAFTEFQNLKLSGLTESCIIRNNDNDNNDPYSFARTLVRLMMDYVQTTHQVGVMPFNLGELCCPQTLVFVNVEQHAHASARQVADEWQIINKSLNMKVKLVNNKKLATLTGTIRAIQKITSRAQSAASMPSGIQRAYNARFRKTALKPLDMARLIKRVIKKMANVAKSENSYKSVKMTYARPNRRDPDDFNKQGKMVSTKYKPDLHVYLDTSGSISETNYQQAIKSLIKMARKMNVNLYFNSFSDSLSQCSHITTKDCSLKQAYAAFLKIPKVTGGTDYEQIWHYINKSPKRKRELSLIITDFEYYAPNKYVEHPKNLYYLPIDNSDWSSITYYAHSFCESMKHIDPKCRAKILF